MDYRFWMYENHDMMTKLNDREPKFEMQTKDLHFPVLTWYLVSGLVVALLVAF